MNVLARHFANDDGINGAARLEQMGCTCEVASAVTIAAALERNVRSLIAALGRFKKESSS